MGRPRAIWPMHREVISSKTQYWPLVSRGVNLIELSLPVAENLSGDTVFKSLVQLHLRGGESETMLVDVAIMDRNTDIAGNEIPRRFGMLLPREISIEIIDYIDLDENTFVRGG